MIFLSFFALVTLLHSSHDRANFSSTTIQNFQNISEKYQSSDILRRGERHFLKLFMHFHGFVTPTILTKNIEM
jgi:hypothetical protein